ncbi:DNA-3-methyladenine glycosylase I [Reichenbachiella faecimaris]|uniref:DNA-3-methyladenine glycosylase I n=1 Tax=Reichenbachiella faecimaris TaxID=692418 RepID=A0A1W2GCV8_REIFA|nr:DNA-3-methyladenine glycosylase I [Reichenbachiella faecimaris]SMD34493.1 DNA-3-methyladenine glycosylase I [Reichenbachiella faecimaris]
MCKCEWAIGHFDEYEKYHDDEWGVPSRDDKVHFEFMILESAQAGLSWSTVLKKRAGYQEAFANFEVEKVAKFDDARIESLISNPAIIRNKQKIRAAVNNAKHFIDVQKEFGTFSKYIWSFVNDKTITGHWKTKQEVPATTPASDELSKDLKKRGFKFVGSTIMYAHMQATGLVNDHTTDCYRYKELLS